MRVISADSEETTGEGANGPARLVLDGNPATYWHTKWQGGIAPLPHNIYVDLGSEISDLSRIDLTPRQSSNGSGRVHEYEVQVSTDGQCASADTVKSAAFTKVAEGAFTADDKTSTRSITFTPTAARCVNVIYRSSWGGNNAPEKVASLAEFNAYRGSDETAPPEPTNPDPSENPAPAAPTDPTGGIPADQLTTLTDGTLTVTARNTYPQIVSYTAPGGAITYGSTAAAPTTITVNGASHPVTSERAGEPTATSIAYTMRVTDMDISFTATMTVKDGAVSVELSNLQDPQSQINTIALTQAPVVSIPATDTNATVGSTRMSTNRNNSGDTFETVSQLSAGDAKNSWLIVPSTTTTSFGMDSNGIEDGSNGQVAASGSAELMNRRWVRQVVTDNGATTMNIMPGTFTWRGAAVNQYKGSIGLEANPKFTIKPVGDVTGDGEIDWQDGTTAYRQIHTWPNGANEVADTVITRIPFNIVSQATHPFLRTLDDTKRVSLETDNLGQQVMLKGYQAEGHDSAHPDYGGHYNERAGGMQDLRTLADEAVNWNAQIGVHVNATESYSEAHNFSEDLLRMPPQAAWGWMNQSYYINSQKDLATGNIIKRFQQFYDEKPANLTWLYIDVYYNQGWEAQRLGAELQKMGWEVSSEWAYSFADYSLWSHWANDENYGGATNKGINSNIFRYAANSYRDTWNPDPKLGNTNVVEFEGWTGHINHQKFIRNIWERNLPTKFLQRSNIVDWEDNSVTFENGTKVVSDVASVAGTVIPTDRVITYDGATVYTDGAYLLPWSNGGSDRLYLWNPRGGDSTWKLTNSWASQKNLTVYQLTDTGRKEVGTVAVKDGSITVPSTVANTAYVLYPTSAVPAPRVANWGQGSGINDPGFFSGTLDSYKTEGNADVVYTDRGNYQARLGEGASSITAALGQGADLPAGTYNASAWIDIDTGRGSRDVKLQVTGDGVKAAGTQAVVDGVPTTSLTQSTAMNATASDEKLRTYFQRARVTFTTTGGPVSFKISAGDGTHPVYIDDLRLTSFTTDDIPAALRSEDAKKVVTWENFEHPDTGYWPFVTGRDNAGGDARTQLAERHEPYSQKGWYGKNANGKVVAGGKLIDNVLDGHWSLMAHEENGGLILRTTQASVPMESGHTYRVSFDYQNAVANAYAVVTAFDKTGQSGAPTTTELSREVLPVKQETTRYTTEITTAGSGTYWFGIRKVGGGHQADLSIDNILVEDLGPAEHIPALASLDIATETALHAGVGSVVTTTLRSAEDEAITNVTHSLEVPEGWEVSLISVDKTELAPGEVSTARWLVTPPADAPTSPITATSTYKIGESGREISKTVNASVQHETLRDGRNYLSDLPFASESNGWGPIERDQSNGEKNRNDGVKPISIGDVKYQKGLGTHAPSRVEFALNGQCTAFHAVVGVDDAQSSARASVTFEVRDGNGKVLAGPTRTLRAADAGVELNADITGVDRLVLIVTPAGDGNGNDHASWGDAQITCAVASEENAEATLTATPASVELGAPVTLAAAGFKATAADAPLGVYNSATGEQIGTMAIGEDGTGTLEYTVPENAEPGAVTVQVRQDLGNGQYRTASATFTVGAPAPAEVTPAAPTFADNVVTIPETEGAEYVVDGEVVTGTITLSADKPSVTVTARAKNGYALAEGAKAEWTFKYTAPVTPPGPTEPPTPPTEPVTPPASQAGNVYLRGSVSTGVADTVFQYGRAGDEVFFGDWNGDGIKTVGLRRGNTFYLKNTNTPGAADIVFTYGRTGDQLVVGDWNGDGTDTIGVYRNRTFYLSNTLTGSVADATFIYGRNGDVPVAGDWNGDGTDTVGVQRGRLYYLSDTNTAGHADHTFAFGRPGDIPVVGDADGNGTDTVSVRRGREFFVKNTLADGPADTVAAYGAPSDTGAIVAWLAPNTPGLAVTR